jgi:hypothetical protein
VINGKKLHFFVNFIKSTKACEFYLVEGNDRKIVLSNNRPMLQGKGLKNFPLHWEVVEGEMKNKIALEKICEAILEEIENPNS